MSQSNFTVTSYLTPWLKVSGNEQDYGFESGGNTDDGLSNFYKDVVDAINNYAGTESMPALDGSVAYESMTIIHSGHNQAKIESSANSTRLWSRYDYLSSPAGITKGGGNLKIQRSDYEFSSWMVTMVLIWVCLAHDYAHVLGLPDLCMNTMKQVMV